MKATQVIITGTGGPEVMQLKTIELPPPGPGEVQLEQTAIGLNYMDVYHRSGFYPLPLPSPLGLEAAGRIIASGDGVDDLKVGDRVAYAGVLGAYASHRNAPAARMVKLPENVSDQVAAAAMLKGMTVEYLLERTYPVQPGDDVLFWAASGGVGQMAGQWGADLGARMIGVTSGAQNCADALKLGYADAIDRTSDDVAERVRALTDGRGVQVVYDSVGAASYEASLNSLATRGVFVSFGATTGPTPEVNPQDLQLKGSMFFTRPTLAHYIASRDQLDASAAAVFARLGSGVMTANINRRMALADIVAAHQALEAGKTTGSTILEP